MLQGYTCGDLCKFPEGLRRALAEKSKKAQYAHNPKAKMLSYAEKQVLVEKAKKTVGVPLKVPKTPAIAPPKARPTAVAKASTGTKVAAKPATSQFPSDPAEIAAAKMKLQQQQEALATHEAQRLVEIAEAKSAEAETEAQEGRSKEMALQHEQLAMEEAYLASLAGMTGPSVEERRRNHEDNIMWHKHSITNLKAPAQQVAAYRIGVATTEKKLVAADTANTAAKAALATAQAEADTAFEMLEKAKTALADVKNS